LHTQMYFPWRESTLYVRFEVLDADAKKAPEALNEEEDFALQEPRSPGRLRAAFLLLSSEPLLRDPLVAEKERLPMPRRQKRSILEILLEDTAAVPWPFGLIIALVVFFSLRYWLPGQLAESSLLTGLGELSATIAPWAALLFVIASGVSAWRSFDSRKLLERNRTLPISAPCHGVTLSA